MHRSSVVLCLSKPSTSIYLDFCPRDQCFKVAYIVEDCNYTVNPKNPGTIGKGESEDVAPVALEEITNSDVEPLLQRDVKSEEEASGTLLRASREKLCNLIDHYNEGHPTDLGMQMEEDGSSFRGFIRVHMNLCRPIRIAGSLNTSPYDTRQVDNAVSEENATVTSFHLPRDTVKALHITSEATTCDVIFSILQKFKIVDSPKKFALYERYFEEGDTVKVKMRRIGESEKPLVLALRWSQEQECNKMFVLQENETGDILWEAFSLPELGNFLRILDREEEEYKRIVRQKYKSLSTKIQEAMDKIHPPQQTTSRPMPEDASALPS